MTNTGSVYLQSERLEKRSQISIYLIAVRIRITTNAALSFCRNPSTLREKKPAQARRRADGFRQNDKHGICAFYKAKGLKKEAKYQFTWLLFA
jgi:hypothetical protein